MLSTIERVLFLKSADIFSAIAGEDLIPVESVAEEVSFQVGETFIRQGEPGDCLYVVVDGEASVEARGVGQVAVHGPRSVLGEMAILSGRPRSADCTAITDIIALRVDRNDFLDLLAERPPLALGVIKVLTQRLEEATQHLSKLGRS